MILVTGATGFVGTALIQTLIQLEYGQLKAAVRQHCPTLPATVTQIAVADIGAATNWSAALTNVDVVIHVAGRAHLVHDPATNPLDEFLRVNTDATTHLAQQAALRNITRFIFVSSAKVNGENSKFDQPFRHDDKFTPVDPYAYSKYKAEHELLQLAQETPMEVVIIRPPLVYGPNALGNFATLVSVVNKGIPLPLGAIHNKRSLIALDNLVSFIIHCIDHAKATNQVFMVADGEDVSTTELLKKVAKAFNRSIYLLPIPVAVMRLFAKVIGKQDAGNRLFGSFQVDSDRATVLLDWQPVITMDKQLKKLADASSQT